MKLKIFLFITLGLFAVNESKAQVPNWFSKLKEIKVFQSSRQDVERVFENSKAVYSSDKDGKEDWGEIVEYETPEGKIRVFYSTGRCSKEDKGRGWDLDENIVVNIQFTPVKPVKLSKLKLDLNTFSWSREIDTEYWHYQSSQLGVKFAVLEGKVMWFKYLVPDEMRKLHCENVLNKQN